MLFEYVVALITARQGKHEKMRLCCFKLLNFLFKLATPKPSN